MNRKTKNLIRAIAVIIVLLVAVEAYTEVSIPSVGKYAMELMLISFGMVLFVSR